MKSGKAPGSDGIAPEMLKCLETSGRKYLQWVVNRAWKTQSIPQEWSNAVILPIHKKGKYYPYTKKGTRQNAVTIEEYHSLM